MACFVFIRFAHTTPPNVQLDSKYFFQKSVFLVPVQNQEIQGDIEKRGELYEQIGRTASFSGFNLAQQTSVNIQLLGEGFLCVRFECEAAGYALRST